MSRGPSVTPVEKQVSHFRCSYQFLKGPYCREYCGRSTDGSPYCTWHAADTDVQCGALNCKTARLKPYSTPAPTSALALTVNHEWLTTYLTLEVGLDTPIIEGVALYWKWIQESLDTFAHTRSVLPMRTAQDPSLSAMVNALIAGACVARLVTTVPKTPTACTCK